MDTRHLGQAWGFSFGFHTFVACHVTRLPLTAYRLPLTSYHLPFAIATLHRQPRQHEDEYEVISFPFAISHSTTLFSICALSEKRLPQWVIK